MILQIIPVADRLVSVLIFVGKSAARGNLAGMRAGIASALLDQFQNLFLGRLSVYHVFIGIEDISVGCGIDKAVAGIFKLVNLQTRKIINQTFGKDAHADQTDCMMVLVVNRLIHGDNLLITCRRVNNTGVENASACLGHAVVQLRKCIGIRSGDHVADQRIRMCKHLRIPVTDINTLKERCIRRELLHVFLCFLGKRFVLRIVQKCSDLLCMTEIDKRFFCIGYIVIDNQRTLIVERCHLCKCASPRSGCNKEAYREQQQKHQNKLNDKNPVDRRTVLLIFSPHNNILPFRK